jgi:hypothetical protein
VISGALADEALADAIAAKWRLVRWVAAKIQARHHLDRDDAESIAAEALWRSLSRWTDRPGGKTFASYVLYYADRAGGNLGRKERAAKRLAAIDRSARLELVSEADAGRLRIAAELRAVAGLEPCVQCGDPGGAPKAGKTRPHRCNGLCLKCDRARYDERRRKARRSV